MTDAAAPPDPRSLPRLGFVLEQTLGHVTHSKNLQTIIGRDHTISAIFIPIPFSRSERSRWLPGYGNWTIRAGHRTRQAMRTLRRRHAVDAVFIHTQVLAVFAALQVRRTRAVVSIDATPMQYDALGPHYAHARSPEVVERLKLWLNRNTFRSAAHVVSWSRWGKASLMADYAVPEDKITVIPPGVHVSRWARGPRACSAANDTVRVLFVGGDLERKGGLLLLEAIREVQAELRRRPNPVAVELHLVTGADVPAGDGIVVHAGLSPNDPTLIELYHSADIFCLPTLGDCLPMVLSEAGAARLPLVSTRVGAIPEIVKDGETGLLIEAGDLHGLVTTLLTLIDDPQLRVDLGQRAYELVVDQFDAEKNAHDLVQLMYRVAGA